MNIIHIVNRFLPQHGGVEMSVACLAEAQRLRGHLVTVITETPSDGDDDLEYDFQILRFAVPIVRPLTRLLYWKWMWKHRTLLNSADVVHFHDYTTFIHWFLPLRPIIRKPLYAVTFHGFEHWPVRLRHRIMRNITARLTHARFAVGKYIASYYGHAIDAFHVGAPVRSLPRLRRGDDLVFAYVGRLAPDTGILRFAEGLRGASVSSGVNVELRLAGDGPERETLSALSHDGFSVVLYGVVDDPVPVYLGARYLIATGFLSLYEAFQTGIPVLVPAFNEIKRRYAHSIEDIDALALLLENSDDAVTQLQALLRGENEAETMSRAQAAARWVMERGWDAIAAMTDQVYRDKLTTQIHPFQRNSGVRAFV